ncbi:MAG: hypothetical protein OEZ59_13635 [Deltaproteobacteria bacterium]|nr:hypothetical protein [Deltaproteobacteria bacterium]
MLSNTHRPICRKAARQAGRITVFGLALLLLLAALSGCGGKSATPPEETTGAQGEKKKVFDPNNPFAAGVLNAIAEIAPEKSPSRLLGRIAAELGWEEQVAENVRLRKAVEDEKFEENVQSYLLGLYYNNGFTVLPVVGEGHQFARNSIVRGAVANTRLLVTNREKLYLLFLGKVENIQIVYHKDGVQPQVFTLDPNAVIALRQSHLEHYLR